MGKRAVSPIVGVILMVAVTITLAAVTAAFVMDIGSDRQFQAGGVSLEIVYGDPKAPNPDDPYIKIQAVSTGGAERLWVQGNSTDKWLIQGRLRL